MIRRTAVVGIWLALVLTSCTVAPEHPARTATTTTPPPDVSSPTGGSSALAALRALPVKGRAPKTGYARARFGPAWSDDTGAPQSHNGCDTRNDVLRRDLRGIVLRPRTHGCVVASGMLHDPYTGREIDFVRGVRTSTAVQIDHVVALGDAWQTGAQQLSADQRADLANDPLELLAVDGPINESKGDGDAASWLPPNTSFRCTYVARQVAVKRKYHLWVTAAESAAIARILARCPGQSVVSGGTGPTG